MGDGSCYAHNVNSLIFKLEYEFPIRTKSRDKNLRLRTKHLVLHITQTLLHQHHLHSIIYKYHFIFSPQESYSDNKNNFTTFFRYGISKGFYRVCSVPSFITDAASSFSYFCHKVINTVTHLFLIVIYLFLQ